ncbi:RNA methyltransferase [Psychroflexus aestuariivivens]|uniref:RNA methyltransferase n=1 Tax=Psychroflexus aestuariivivens TaxID=1795040 RepID=UPI000FD7E90A|nr:RNA methyltransferase [Psychroflexus aestuariivivens]
MPRKLKNSELDRKTEADFKTATKTPLIIILDNIRSLNNIGSVFRSSDAFLIQKIYLCGITAQPPHKDIQKTALGATNTVDWEYAEKTEDIVKKLQAKNVKVCAIEQAENSKKLSDFQPQQNETYAFILGNEVKGVQQSVVDLADEVLEIPQLGTKHSLNISVTTGICIWDFVQKTNIV